MSAWHRRTRRKQFGLSLVELMVGIAVGLFMVAAASLLVSAQLSDNRRLLLETQVQQDLRATADIITRELRRAGGLAGDVVPQTVWYQGTPLVRPNLLNELTPTAGASTSASYHYQFNIDSSGPFEFALEGTRIRAKLGDGTVPQDLTDESTLRVTSFTVTPTLGPPVQLPCPRVCADDTTDCWPTVQIRQLEVAIEAEARSDPTVRRSIRSNVRLRNDTVQFNDVANPTLICPQ